MIGNKSLWAPLTRALVSSGLSMLGQRQIPQITPVFRLLGTITTLAIAACSAPNPTKQVASPKQIAEPSLRLDQPLEGLPRLFHTSIDDAFWVGHSAERDRLISSGVRLEVSTTTGEVFASSWEIDNELKNDTLIGALEVPARLGGGFVHWSRNQLFRSETFTGALQAIAIKHALGIEAIRGARNGLQGIIVFGESAAATLLPNQKTLTAPPYAGLIDFAALDEQRAVRLDVVGHIHTTIDGGKTWVDATPIAGWSQKQLLVEPDAINVLGWQGRSKFNADGTLGPLETTFTAARRGLNYSMIFRGSRAEDTNAWWTWREIAPVQAAVLGGARVDPTHALGLAAGALATVSLTTGDLAQAMTDWPQSGLSCSGVAGQSEPVLICGWETYQGYGAYVLRAERGAWPPVIERAFTDDGYFVTDDHGALAFVGSCTATPRYVDPNDMSRMDLNSEGFRVAPKICVRRGPNDWIEHEIEIDDDSQLQGWAPKLDGSAVAFVVRKETTPLPDPTNDPTRVTTQGSVRILRLPRDVGGFVLPRPAWNPYGGSGRTPAGPLVERRIQAHDDGTISAWFMGANNSDPTSGLHAGASIDKRGEVTLYPPPAHIVSMIATSQYGLALLRDGTLAETLDHGRTYRSGGLSPVTASNFSGYCTMLGCVVNTLTRLGWGQPKTEQQAFAKRLEPPASPQSPWRLECSPKGSINVVEDNLLHRGNRQTWATGTGDAITLIREVENLPDAQPQAPPQLPPDPDDPPTNVVAPPTKSLRVQTRTQSLLFRPPFDPDALPKRLDATGTELDNVRRLGVIPLLGKDDDIGLLIISDKHEILLQGDVLTTLPMFEQRRYMSDDTRYPPGLLLGANRALIIGDVRRRSALEEHGPGQQRAPIYLGQERDSSTRRPMSLARRQDGTQGLVVWEGFPPEIAAVAELDAKSQTFSGFTPLASWSRATPGDDPSCKNMKGWTTILPIDPSLWLDLQTHAGLGIDVGTTGTLLVRWNQDRLCLDALDVAIESRNAYEWRFDSHLVMRFFASGKKRRGGTLFRDGTRRAVDCRLVPVKDTAK